MDTEQLDLDFGPEPPLVVPTARVQAGRRALRRRRIAQGVAGTLGAFAAGGVGWIVVPGLAAHKAPLAAGPTATVLTELPVQEPGECLGDDFCVELVPHGMRTLSPRIPGGDMALGFRNGELVRLSVDVDVVKAIVDPTETGATASAAVEVVFRDTRFRVALAEGFGYITDQIEGEPPTSLEKWFAERHDLPGGDCAVQSHDVVRIPREAVPGPEECWLTVDDRGTVQPHPGVTIERTVELDLPDGALPPGIEVTGAAFTRDGADWFGVVRRIGGNSFVSTTLALVDDLPESATLEGWLQEAAVQPSISGIPDPDYREQPEPWQTLQWWNPKTGAFDVPAGATVVRRVENPMKYAAPEDSAGLIFEFRGKRYWALTQKHSAPPAAEGRSGDPDDIRTAGVSVTQAEGARSDGDFDSWLATVVSELATGYEDTP